MYSRITPKVPKAPGRENADRAGPAAYRRDLTKFRTNDCALRLVHAALALPGGLSRIQMAARRCPRTSGRLSYKPSATTAGAKGGTESPLHSREAWGTGTSGTGPEVREDMDHRRLLHRILLYCPRNSHGPRSLWARRADLNDIGEAVDWTWG